MSCKAATLPTPPGDTDLYRRLIAGHPDAKGRRVSAENLSTALAREGIQIGTTAIKDHRAGRCVCARKATA